MNAENNQKCFLNLRPIEECPLSLKNGEYTILGINNNAEKPGFGPYFFNCDTNKWCCYDNTDWSENNLTHFIAISDIDNLFAVNAELKKENIDLERKYESLREQYEGPRLIALPD